MTDPSLENIGKLLPGESIPLLTDYIALHPSSDKAYTLRGLKYWAVGNRAAAIADYHHAISLNPESDAASALAMAESILNFYNKDLLNP